jgi:hypothetical protein
MKTIYFEEKFNVDIDDFKCTKDVDDFIESKIGRKLKVSKCNCNLIGED